MITIEKEKVYGWAEAIRGMRNPMNSWSKSDSGYNSEDLLPSEGVRYLHDFYIGPNDKKLMKDLALGGPVHAKYRRMITVYIDITAPLYWWKEFDTYKVGTVANSCSTMHKIQAKEFTIDNFSHEHLFDTGDMIGMFPSGEKLPKPLISVDGNDFYYSSVKFLECTCNLLNYYRDLFNETKDKRYWWQMIQLLPSSYNQKRTVMLNYEVLHNIYCYRSNHKLDEWRYFCEWIEKLPFSCIITDSFVSSTCVKNS